MRLVYALVVFVSLSKGLDARASPGKESVAGVGCLKTAHGTYLSYQGFFEGISTTSHCKRCENWFIDCVGEKVYLRPFCDSRESLTVNSKERSLSFSFWNSVGWKPLLNDDGSWSFQSVHSDWLKVDSQGHVGTTENGTDASTNFVLEDWKEPEPDTASLTSVELSKMASGQRCIKSFYGTFLRNTNSSKEEVYVASECGNCEHWFVEDHQGKIALRSECSPGRYLSATGDDSVALAEGAGEKEMWIPRKKEGGAWSLKGDNGKWLRVQPHGRISLQENDGLDEMFWLESWEEPSTTTLEQLTPETVEPSTVELQTTESRTLETPISNLDNLIFIILNVVIVCIFVFTASVYCIIRVNRKNHNKSKYSIDPRSLQDANSTLVKGDSDI